MVVVADVIGLAAETAGIRLIALRTPTLPPATHTNAWVIGRQRVTVVDPPSPWADEQARLLAALDRAGVEVDRILLTHHHPDHVGGVEALVAAGAARGRPISVYAHAETLARIGVEGIAVDVAEPWLTDDGAFELHHTPGHAPGHLVIVDPRDRAAIVGDMVAGTGTILIGPDDGDLGEYLASLERMRTLRLTRLIPSHGPTLVDADATLARYIAHRHMRSAALVEALGVAGPASVEALVPLVYGPLDPHTAVVAALQLFAHLRWLRGEGVVRAEGEGWTRVE